MATTGAFRHEPLGHEHRRQALALPSLVAADLVEVAADLHHVPDPQVFHGVFGDDDRGDGPLLFERQFADVALVEGGHVLADGQDGRLERGAGEVGAPDGHRLAAEGRGHGQQLREADRYLLRLEGLGRHPRHQVHEPPEGRFVVAERVVLDVFEKHLALFERHVEAVEEWQVLEVLQSHDLLAGARGRPSGLGGGGGLLFLFGGGRRGRGGLIGSLDLGVGRTGGLGLGLGGRGGGFAGGGRLGAFPRTRGRRGRSLDGPRLGTGGLGSRGGRGEDRPAGQRHRQGEQDGSNAVEHRRPPRGF